MIRTLALLLALAPLPALAEKETPPPLGTPKDFALPAVETYTLPNGMGVTLIPYGSVPKFSATLQIRTGRLDENVRGLTDLFVALMNEGIGGKSAADVARASGDMGGGVGFSGGSDTMSAGVSALSEFAAPAIALLADQVRRPNLPESELPRLKQDALRGLAVSLQSPQTQADIAFARAFYGQHPFGQPVATAADLQAISYAQIKQFFDSQLGAQRAHLYIAGQFDTAALKPAIAKAFGDWQAGPAITVNPPRLNDRLAVHLVGRPNAPQSTLIVGLPMPDAHSPDRIALGVTNELLGGDFSSRITLSLREDKGYAYSPDSSFSLRPGFGRWIEVADVTAANTADSLKVILDEIGRLKQDAPPEDELDRVKNALAGSYLFRIASRGGLIGSYASYDLLGVPRAELGRYVATMRKVSAQDVKQVMNAYFDTPRMTVVIVGDEAQVRAQMAALPELNAAMTKP